jgi:hypothetical protein
MTRAFIRYVALGGLVLVAASGCQSLVTSQLKAVSVGHTGCTAEQLTISNHQISWTGETWNATCNDKVYLCSGVASGKNTEDYSCAPVAK